MLKEAGIKTCLIGNIGVPVFESLESSAGATPVIELSSHQLEFMHTSPHIAIVTNIYPEHLDHYNGFEGYARAKLNILKYQRAEDFLICGENLGELAEGEISRSNAQRTRIGMHMWENDEFLSSLAKLNPKLPGGHNAYDISLAATAAERAGADRDAIRRAIESFTGIPHRMENIGSFRGITFYNDSIATIPQAVKCAVEALGDVDTLIVGGKDRGLDYSEFVRFLASCGVRNIICLPETGHAIASSLEKIGCTKVIFRAVDMEKAVEAAYSLTEKGKICLMSPAASSYNKYRNFEEKGEHYRALVEQWGTK